MFILSDGLTRTGIADILETQLLRVAGQKEVSLIVVMMLCSEFLSAFMNNIGVAALMLPVVVDISRRTEVPPSRLLMPLAYGCLLGGLTTLIGTPPNLPVSAAMEQNGLEPFSMFDFAPIGIAALVVGAIFIAADLATATTVALRLRAPTPSNLSYFWTPMHDVPRPHPAKGSSDLQPRERPPPTGAQIIGSRPAQARDVASENQTLLVA
jgi:di/tricarboxylate transporter